MAEGNERCGWMQRLEEWEQLVEVFQARDVLFTDVFAFFSPMHESTRYWARSRDPNYLACLILFRSRKSRAEQTWVRPLFHFCPHEYV